MALILTRQKLPSLDQSRYASATNLQKGAYILSEAGGTPDVILIATGSELQLALRAQDVLTKEGLRIRVVSMPSWELFEEQDEAYRNAVLPPQTKRRLAIEAGVTFGWYKWVTSEGDVIGIDRFGLSAPGEEVLDYFGFTVENVCSKARALAGI
ncbi:MAG TPA: transketolase C-terminal domain-containing protein [Chitinophagaceae bacterium]|nr:transketolase C-terminal domain-containing protein [Chitinophagaceae bacterium]